jgi:hypothetical protein
MKMRRKDCKHVVVEEDGDIIWSSHPWHAAEDVHIATLYAWWLKADGTRSIHPPGTGKWVSTTSDEDWEELK